MGYADEIRNQIDRRQYLIGRIEEANFWIDYFASKKSDFSKKKLKEAKRLRDNDMRELKTLS